MTKQNPNVKPDVAGHIAVSHLECDTVFCNYCEGGLFSCILCHSHEGATTSECPKEPMTADQSDAVYAGELDYRAGEWRKEASRHSPPGSRAFFEAIKDGKAKAQWDEGDFKGVAFTSDMLGACPPGEYYYHKVPCVCEGSGAE